MPTAKSFREHIATYIVALMVVFFIAGCSEQEPAISTYSATPTISPTIKLAERITSSTDRFTAQLWRYEGSITNFEISDQKTQKTYHQDLSDVEGLYIVEGAWSIDGGHYFKWTPSERYLVILTSPRVHGCSFLLVYAGDGTKLVYSSVATSLCGNNHFTDEGIMIKELCANDDIFFWRGIDHNLYRFRPSTLEETFIKKAPFSEDNLSACEMSQPIFEALTIIPDVA
jgi:hypothetical protein